jgi:hypothetical protein
MRSFCAQVTILDRQWHDHKQFQACTLTQPSANQLLILADQATNFPRQAQHDEGAEMRRSFVTEVDLVLEKVGDPFHNLFRRTFNDLPTCNLQIAA